MSTDPSGAAPAPDVASDPGDPGAHLQRLETIFQAAPLGIGIVTPDGHTIMSNDTLRRLLGYSADEFAAKPWAEFTHPDDVEPNLVLFERMKAGEIDHFSMEKRFIRTDGSILWAHLTSSMVRDAQGRPDYVIGMVEDITERKRLERELRTAEEHYRVLVERVPAVVYIADAGPAGRWHYVSPQVQEMLGFTPAEWMADPELWHRQLHPDDRARVVGDEQRYLDHSVEFEDSSTSYRLFHRDGRLVWVRDDAMAITEPDGRVTWHGVLVDVTREKHLEERLGHQAFHDPLTGLPNRTLLHGRAAEALERMAHGGGPVAVLLIDLDHFKNINDSFGHAYGDQVIVTAARRIKSCVRGRDTAARLGGDEFALLVEGASPEALVRLADRVLQALRDSPMRLGELTLSIGGSIGIATAMPGDDTDTLLRNADLAMYRAKRQGRGRYFHYSGELHDELVNRLRLEEALHAAIRERQITLAFQPIVDMDGGWVVGLEALARWHDPDLGQVPPGQFVPVAEQTGVIRELGLLVVERACQELAAWRAGSGVDAYVSVNVSPLQLDDDFPAAVDKLLREAGLAPSALVLEVTEGLLLVESSRTSVADLRSRGVRVAIDDFGTGYSSLSYLRDLPVDMIKLDRMFLRPGPQGADDQTLLNALLGLATGLGLDAVCEGVETEAQLATLRRAGCRFAQGFLLRRPGPLTGVPARLDLRGLG